jgi:hypothetical protein
MAIKEKTLVEMIDLWFEGRTQLSKADFEMIKKFYWIIVNRGGSKK